MLSPGGPRLRYGLEDTRFVPRDELSPSHQRGVHGAPFAAAFYSPVDPSLIRKASPAFGVPQTRLDTAPAQQSAWLVPPRPVSSYTFGTETRDQCTRRLAHPLGAQGRIYGSELIAHLKSTLGRDWATRSLSSSRSSRSASTLTFGSTPMRTSVATVSETASPGGCSTGSSTRLRPSPVVHKNAQKKDLPKASTSGAFVTGIALACMPTREMRAALLEPPLSESELLELSELFKQCLEASLAKQTYKGANGIGNLFAYVDADGSGFITYDEFEPAVRKKLHIKKGRLSDDRLKALWCAIDGDDSNQIHVNEFSMFVKGLVKELLDAARPRPTIPFSPGSPSGRLRPSTSADSFLSSGSCLGHGAIHPSKLIPELGGRAVNRFGPGYGKPCKPRFGGVATPPQSILNAKITEGLGYPPTMLKLADRRGGPVYVEQYY